MRIVRFKLPGSSAVEYGAVFGNRIRYVEGDPFGKYKISDVAVNIDEVELYSSCCPGKIIALAANYKGGSGVSEDMVEPVIFIKPSTSIAAPYQEIMLPFKDVKTWGEPELGIVIGRKTRKISFSESEDAIFGYTSVNDITAENISGRDHHLARAKAADSFCPVGPWIDTEFKTADALIEGFQNGELVRRGNLKDRIWKDEQIVWWLSQWMTLETQDIIITGTPPRVRERLYLENGDVYEVRISGLGNLKNRFVKKPII